MSAAPPAAPAESDERSAARAALRGCWELACVLNFLDVFAPVLALEEEVQAEALEDALLETGVTQPLLHDLHRSLLQGMHPRTTIRSWRVLLAEKLSHEWSDVAEGACPFSPPAAEAEGAYDQLCAVGRVRALRALCELRLDARGDLRECLEGEAEGAASAREGANFHGAPMVGQDNRGQRFFYEACDSGPRLYRERSRVGASAHKTFAYYKRTRGGATRCEQPYTQPGPVLLEGWEIVATTGEAVAALAAELRASKFPGTKNAHLATQLDKLAEEMTAKLRKDEARRAKIARQKVEVEYANIIWDEGRSRRARQPVSYTTEAFDAQFTEALGRAGGAGGSEPPFDPFARRGRSAGPSGADVWADPPDSRRRGGAEDEDEEDAGEDSDGSSEGGSDAWREGGRSDDADE